MSCGPWCQGPVLLQALSLLEGYDLQALGHNTPAYVHVVTEALKLCFADRERYFGDPRFVDVPMDTLLSPAYAAERRRLIREDRAWPEMPPAGAVPGFDGAPAPRATRHADQPVAAGNSPALPGRYLLRVRGRSPRQRDLGHAERRDLGEPGHPGPGLLPVVARVPVLGGARATPRAVAPGKRPRLTPNPALAMRGAARGSCPSARRAATSSPRACCRSS